MKFHTELHHNITYTCVYVFYSISTFVIWGGGPWEGLRRCSAKPRDSVGISAGEPPALLCARYMPPFRDIMMGKMWWWASAGGRKVLRQGPCALYYFHPKNQNGGYFSQGL